VRISRGFKLAQKYRVEFLKLRITTSHIKIRSLKTEKGSLQTELQAALGRDIYSLLMQHIRISINNQTKKVSGTHDKKLNNLRKTNMEKSTVNK